MADGTTVANPTPAAAQPQSIDSVIAQRTKAIDKATQEEAQVTDEGAQAIAAADKRAQARDEQLVGEEKDVWANMQQAMDEAKHPPQMETPAQTSPQQMWSSNAMVFAALASLFTRRPLLTAINSAAAALKAFNTGNQEAVNAAFQKWKIDTDNFYKVADAQQKVYSEEMATLRSMLEESDRADDREVRDITAMVTAKASALKDQAMADARDVTVMVQLYSARERAVQAMQVNGQKIEEGLLFQQGMASWRATHPHATPDEAIQHAGQLRQTLGHQWNPQEEDSQVTKFDAMAPKSPPGQAYNSAVTQLGKITQYPVNGPHDAGEVIRQAAALDGYIQSINGNRAIRGFQLKLVQQDMGLANSFHQAVQQLGGGGAVTPEMIRTMKKLASDYAHIATQNYADYITGYQWQQHTLGLDPIRFTPPDFNPQQVGLSGQYPQPSAEAVAALKGRNNGNPTRQDWVDFDQIFGQGAAAFAFSSEMQGQGQ